MGTTAINTPEKGLVLSAAKGNNLIITVFVAGNYDLAIAIGLSPFCKWQNILARTKRL